MKHERKQTELIGMPLILAAISFMLIGCDDREKRKAVEEATQAKNELIKLKAENIRLKGELSFLRAKLQTAEQARDNLQLQLDELLDDREAVITEADTAQEQIDQLAPLLAEQTKKATEMEKQVEQLKAVIRELQTMMEQKARQANTLELKQAAQPNDVNEQAIFQGQ